MLIEQEIAARRERAQGAVARILARPDADVYGDYQVRSSSNKTYRVALRGPGLFENYCSCPDFAVNTLGTCKHIEALLLRLGRRHGKAFEQGKFSRAQASLSLHYGETLGVRLRLPSSPSPALQALAREYFDESGLLKSERLRDFEKTDGRTVRIAANHGFGDGVSRTEGGRADITNTRDISSRLPPEIRHLLGGQCLPGAAG